MKKVLCMIMVLCVVLCGFSSGLAEGQGRSYKYVLSGVSDDLDGNIYGWYTGDIDSPVVIITGLGNGQDAYDANAIPSYTDGIWSTKNVYWFAAEVNGRSGSIHDGFTKTELDQFAQAHYTNVKSAFPNATMFVVGGYSAGGWAIASMIDTILRDDGNIIGVFGLDCVPKNGSYDTFVRSIKTIHAMDVPVFIGSSLENSYGNRIEARTAKFAKSYDDFVNVYVGCHCVHGDLCKQSDIIQALTDFVDDIIPLAESQSETSLSDDILSNGNVRFNAVNINDHGVNCVYTFLFDVVDDNGVVINQRSVSLFDYQVKTVAGCDEINDECLEKFIIYYLTVFERDMK